MSEYGDGVMAPHSNEAEMSVLGAMLLDHAVVGEVASILREEDFYQPVHRKIFETIVALDGASTVPDLVTMTSALERAGELEAVGGKTFLIELLEVLPSAANAESYAKIVREKSVLRRLAAAGDEIRTEALTSESPAKEILDRAESSIFEIGEREGAAGTVSVGQVLNETFQRLEELTENRGALTGLDTGYYRFNDKTGGLQPGDLIVLAARPSMGKTTFALNVALNACLNDDAAILFFSLEMGAEQIARNLLCATARVNATRVRNGNITERDWALLNDAAGRLHKKPFLIDATPGLTAMAIRTKSRRVARKLSQKGNGKVGMIVVDYLQLVAPPPKSENRQQEISQISRSLKELARELQAPVIALSQLNRSVDSREDHRPRLSDLRESGAIEQDADVICFLYREDYYSGEGAAGGESDEPRPTELMVAKQRNGPTGNVDLLFFPHLLKFENPATGSAAPAAAG